MTNPRCKGTKEQNMKYADRPILSNEEIDGMILKANSLPTEYFQLRAKCLIALLKKFGKRRSEIARLRIQDLKHVGNDLQFTFTLSKKRKLGLHQFLKFCEKKQPEVLSKPLPEIKELHKAWQNTEAGHRIKTGTSLQSIDLNDKYAVHVVDYLKFLNEDKDFKGVQYLFPAGMTVFGLKYLVFPDGHLGGRQLLRIVKLLNPNAWPHLFRHTKGCQVAQMYGRTLTSVAEVKDSLDLELESTALIYVRKAVPKKQPIET